MSLSLLGWLFALGVVVHNMEEALLLPAWSQRSGRRHPQVEPVRFVLPWWSCLLRSSSLRDWHRSAVRAGGLVEISWRGRRLAALGGFVVDAKSYSDTSNEGRK